MGSFYSLIDPAGKDIQQFQRGRTKGFKLSAVMSEASERILSGYFLSHFDGSLDLACLVATGGFGRSEIFPKSDLDIVFIVKDGAVPKDRVKAVLYPLWDRSLDVGYSVRTVEESLGLSLSDMKVFTSLLDARFIAGSRDLFDKFKNSFIRDVLAEQGEKFLKEIVNLRETRKRKFGDSIYMLEPELKEGRGGLRDYHTALWLAKVRFGGGLEEISGRGLLKKNTLKEFYSALDLLFDLRHRLHMLSNVKNDRLSFEMQPLIAKEKRYGESRHVSKVEKLMRLFYSSAETIDSFLDLMIDRIETRDSFKKPKRITDIFGRAHGKLVLTSGRLFLKRPSNIMKAFALAKRSNLNLHEYLKETILEMKARKDVVWDKESLRIFKGLFSRGEGIYRTLECMHRLGVLETIIPEFKRIRAKVQHDVYHVYTVDVHSLMSVFELEKLECDGLPDFPFLTAMMKRLKPGSRFSLYLAALLHDIGKGGKHHAVRGEKMALKISRDLLIEDENAKKVSFLVGNHLLLSSIAQRRNIDDPVMINKLLGAVKTVENLKLLYLLAFADLRSISQGGGALTPWKNMLLRELFEKAMEFFSFLKRGGRIIDAAINRYKSELSKKVDAASRSEFLRFLDSLPEGYFRSCDGESVFKHFEMTKLLPVKKFACHARVNKDYGINVLTIVTPDRPGLFASLTGALSASGINILSSSVFSTSDGLALDVFLTQGVKGEVLPGDDERWRDFEKIMERSFEPDGGFGEIVKARLMRRKSIIDSSLPVVKTEVRFDNESSKDFSIIEVYAEDRLGLLYDIASLLTKTALNIHFAKITTEGNKAQDIFYVTDRNGIKLSEETTVSIREKIVNALNL